MFLGQPFSFIKMFNAECRGITRWGEFQRKFQERYWNKYVQRGVRRYLEDGKYPNHAKESKVDYVYSLLAKTRYLIPAIDEGELITLLAKHFDSRILDCVLAQKIERIEDFIQALQRLEGSGIWLRRRDENGKGNGEHSGQDKNDDGKVHDSDNNQRERLSNDRNDQKGYNKNERQYEGRFDNRQGRRNVNNSDWRSRNQEVNRDVNSISIEAEIHEDPENFRGLEQAQIRGMAKFNPIIM